MITPLVGSLFTWTDGPVVRSHVTFTSLGRADSYEAFVREDIHGLQDGLWSVYDTRELTPGRLRNVGHGVCRDGGIWRVKLEAEKWLASRLQAERRERRKPRLTKGVIDGARG